MKRQFKFEKVYLIFVFALLYLPIFYLIFYAFNKNGNMNAFTGFTLTYFKALFADSRLILIVVQTFFLAFLSALNGDERFCFHLLGRSNAGKEEIANYTKNE